ncbi:MAG: M20/M25/M40 family metallo-hydrolase [Gemmatimonadota bacterium]
MRCLRNLLVVSVGFASLPLSGRLAAQTFPTDDPVIRAMWEQGMGAGSQVETLAQALMDSIGPRLMGSPAYDAAGDWLIERYRSWGIDAEKRAYGTWNGWQRGYTHVDLIEPRVRTLNGMMLAWSPGTSGPVEGAVVAIPASVTTSDAFDAWLPQVRGAFVLLSFPEPTCRPDESWEQWATEASFAAMKEHRQQAAAAWATRLRSLGADLAGRVERAGAAGVLTNRWSAGWGADKIFSSQTTQVPSLHLSCEDYTLLHRLAERGQGPRLRVDAQSRDLGPASAFNVVGTIPGRERPDEYVLLSAHLDSWDGASGATDNGTGTIMMLEAMRILKQTYPNPRRTIVVGHWGGEEQGLVGSTAFAADHPDIVSGLQAAFNQDNGTWRIDYIRMQGFLGAGAHFGRWLSALPGEITDQIDLDIPGVPETGGSDHMSFICVPAAGFRLQSSYPDYRQYTWHTNLDTYDKVVFSDLKNNATLAAMLAYQASEDPERVPTAQRTLPTNERTGQPQTWPQCRPPRRSPGE